MKKAISVLIAVFMTISVLPLYVFSANAMPSYNSFNMYATVNKDGTLNVSEEWDITFFDDGEIKTFTRNFEKKSKQNKMKNIENYSDISNISVVINNKIYNNSVSDESVTVSEIKTENDNKIVIKAKQTDRNLKLVVNYTLTGCIKLDGKAERLCFRAIDSQTGTVNNAKVQITYPDEYKKTDFKINNNTDLTSVDKNTVTYTSDTVKSYLVIDISSDERFIDKKGLVKYSSFSDKIEESAKTVFAVLCILIIIALLVLTSINALFGDKIKRKKLIKNSSVYENGTKYPEDVTFTECAKNIIEYKISKKSDMKKYVSGLYSLGTADLIKYGFIRFNENSEAVLNIKTFEKLPIHLKCLSELYMKYASVINEIPVLDEDSFTKLKKDTDTYPDYFFNLFTNYIGLIPAYSNKDLKNEDNIVKFLSCVKLEKEHSEDSNIARIITLISNDIKTDEKLIIPLLKPDKSKFDKTEITNGTEKFANNISEYAQKTETLFN